MEGNPLDPSPDATVQRAQRTTFSARSTDGVVLCAEAQGDPARPEILFIHGLQQSRLSWNRQFEREELSGFRLVRFDLRGHGDSDKPPTPDRYADPDCWADDVAAVITAAKLRRPVIVGWSLGGYVIGAYLRKYGGAGLAGVTLIAPATNLAEGLLTPLAGQLAVRMTSRDLAERVAATTDFLAACFRKRPSSVDYDQFLVFNGMPPPTVFEGVLQSPIANLEPVFAAYDGPILLMHGVHDQLVSMTMSERIEALREGCRMSVFTESGHSPFYEEPTRFGRELAAFALSAIEV